MEKSCKILLADDEPSIRKSYMMLFEAEGYKVFTARDGEEAVAAFVAERPDLVLLDVMMPKMNGLVACAKIREMDATVPILFFTAMSSDATLVRGLGCGADDYVEKERSPDEFLARIRAALRRRDAYAASRGGDAAGGDALAKDGPFVFADTVVDFNGMVVHAKGGTSALTRSEGVVLKLLLDNAPRALSYDELFAALRGDGYIGDETALRMVVSRLKGKLGRKAACAIVGQRGLGYRVVK